MSPMTLVLILGGGLAFLLIVIGLVVSTQEEKKFVATRLDRYTQEALEATAAAESSRSAAFADYLSDQAKKFSWGQSISRDLARADLKLRVSEYILLIILSVAGVGGIAWYLGGRSPISLVIGAVIGFLIPGFYVRSAQNKRLRRFDDQLADMLNLVVNGLRAGYSTMQALETVAKELPPPVSDEFRRVVQEMQLGITMERALDNLFRRIPSNDLDLVITAMNVQREVGGNLAEILDTISHTIRERVRIKGEIRVMVSQVTTSGKLLSVLPLVLALALYFLNRSYMMNFFNKDTRWLGIPALILAAVIIVIGYYSMQKIADIEI